MGLGQKFISKKILLIIFGLAIAIGLIVYFNPKIGTQAPIKTLITLKGNVVCLPHLNSYGPQTLECAYGFMDGTGKYYSLDNSNSNFKNLAEISPNEKIEVSGILVPKKDNKYKDIGTIKVTKILRLSKPSNPLETYSDKKSNTNFKYPKQLLTKYIYPFDWPPQVAVTNGSFSCVRGGLESAKDGKTELHTILLNNYCVTKVAEEAVGGVTLKYTYKTVMDKKNIVLTFSLRSIQCSSFDKKLESDCKNEQKSFSPDSLIDGIVQTISFNK